jgi:protease-4
MLWFSRGDLTGGLDISSQLKQYCLESLFAKSPQKERDKMLTKGKIAILPIKGIVTTEGIPSFLLFPWRRVVSSTEIAQFLEETRKKRSIKALVLEINSPGGTPFPCREIAERIKNMDKPIVAWIREYATSGAYWIASSCDAIVADTLSRIGSVGVVSIRADVSDLLKKFGIDVETMASGIFKTLGLPYQKMAPQERQVLEEEIDTIHKFFLEEVQANRKLGKDTLKEISSGKIYFGSEAKNLGLIDSLGGREEALELARKRAKIRSYSIVDYNKKIRRPPGLLKRLLGSL